LEKKEQGTRRRKRREKKKEIKNIFCKISRSNQRKMRQAKSWVWQSGQSDVLPVAGQTHDVKG
jgi:hypothetical protein